MCFLLTITKNDLSLKQNIPVLHSLFYELQYTYFVSIIGHRIKGSTSLSGWVIYLELTDVILIQFEVFPHPQFVEKGMQTFFFIGSGWRMHQHDKYFSGGKKKVYPVNNNLSLSNNKKKRMIITIFIIFFYLKEPPSSLEMLMMIWFCGIHISCQGNGFMFNSAWGWKTCRKLCWIYDHICKAEKGVPLIPNCPFYNVHPSQNQRHGLCAYAKCDG